jgi:hypothetical protein
MTEQDERFKQVQNQQFEKQALATAQEEAVRQEVTENANLLRELRRAGINTEKYDWLEGVLGPEVAAVHAIGNRQPKYEQQVKWGSIGKADQHVAERDPGRLCTGDRLEIAQGAHNRRDKSTEDPLTTDERRVVRSSYEAVANHKSLAAKGQGLKTVGETTVTAKRETVEERDGFREQVGGLLD